LSVTSIPGLIVAASSSPADMGRLVGVSWLVLVAAWAIGRAIRAQRNFAASSAEQAAARVLAEERLRLARELHDVVTHGIGLIAVKASVANHVADDRPDETRDALRVIEATSRATLADLRRALDVLRGEPAASGPLAPSPRLADLPALTTGAGDAGVHVDLTVRGSAELPEGLELSTYRIVQEALTNVVRHAGAVRCTVEVAVGDSALTIDVLDDGRGSPEFAFGHGLTGIRERVGLYGGSFMAGPRAEGGFRVHATLPYTAPMSSRAAPR
jgi:signal transduction histidine kinase